MYRKFKNPKTSTFFDKTLVLSFISDKCGSKREKSIEIEIIGLSDKMSE